MGEVETYLAYNWSMMCFENEYMMGKLRRFDLLV